MTWLEAAGAVFLLLVVAVYSLGLLRKGIRHKERRDVD